MKLTGKISDKKFFVILLVFVLFLLSAVNVSALSVGLCYGYDDGIYVKLVYRNESFIRPVTVCYNVISDTSHTENFTFYNNSFSLNVGNGSDYNVCGIVMGGVTVPCWGNMKIAFNQTKLIESGLSYNIWYNISINVTENSTSNITKDFGRFKFLLTPDTYENYGISTNGTGDIFLNSTIFLRACPSCPNSTKYNMVTFQIKLSTNVTNANFTIATYSEPPTTSNISTSAIGKYIELEADSSIINNLEWYLAKIYYNDSDVVGISESLLKMWYYNETTGTWEVVSNSGVDTTENYVWMNTTHFSTYGVGTKTINITVNYTSQKFFHNETQIIKINASDITNITSVKLTIWKNYNSSSNYTVIFVLSDGLWQPRIYFASNYGLTDLDIYLTEPTTYSAYFKVVGDTNYTSPTIQFTLKNSTPYLYSTEKVPLVVNKSINSTFGGDLKLYDARALKNASLFIRNSTYSLNVSIVPEMLGDWLETGGQICKLDNPCPKRAILKYRQNIENLSLGLYDLNLTVEDDYGNVLNKRIGILKIVDGALNITTVTISGLNSSLNTTSTTNTTMDLSFTQNITNASLTLAYYDQNPTTVNFSSLNLSKYYEIEATADLVQNLGWFIFKIYYNDTDIGGLDESKLRIYYFNSTTGIWTAYTNQSSSWIGGVNVNENYIWANSTHFSVYSFSTYTPPSTPSQPSTSSGSSGGGSITLPKVNETNKTIEENITEEIETVIEEKNETNKTTPTPTPTAGVPTGFAVLIPYATNPIMVLLLVIVVVAIVMYWKKLFIFSKKKT